jgi:MSHA biogenesis protein MshE
MARPEKFRLGEMLVQQKLLSEDQLQAGARGAEENRAQARPGAFDDKGSSPRNRFPRRSPGRSTPPTSTSSTSTSSPSLVRLLPEAQARRFRALVLEERGPPARRLRRPDRPAGLRRGGAPAQAGDRPRRRHRKPAAGHGRPRLSAHRGNHRPGQGTDRRTGRHAGRVRRPARPHPGAEDAPVVKLLQTVFEEALRLRASDIHIEPQESALRIRFRIDGVLHVQTEADMPRSPRPWRCA